MFSILRKPQESVNAEDLETLQNEIEKRLADVITHRWKLEQELDLLNNLSPDSSNQQLSQFAAISDSTESGVKSSRSNNSTQPGGKLRNSIRAANQAFIEAIDVNSSDSTTTAYMSNNGTNATDNIKHETDSVSSESSLTSNLTGSTIITANLADLGSHQQSSSAATNTNKRSLKNSNIDRPPKRFRPDGNSLHSHPKRLPHMKQQRVKSEESRPLKKQIIKNEAPDKLWPFVDQFCATPNEDQIRDLEQMIQALENDQEYYKVPTRQQDNDTSNNNSNSNTSNNTKEKAPQRRKAKDNTLGALTQRVVSSFIEESEEDAALVVNDDSAPTPTKRSKSVGDVGNAKNLERKIRQQLEEYSILTQQDDIPFTSEEDEHSRQLRAYQHELLTIQAQNKHYMQILLKRAKKHMELEKEREKLRMASADVIAVYQRLIQAKQKKRSPTKKEKDAAWKALKTHEAIFKKCDDLYLSNRLVTGCRDFPDQ